jgi:glc operon protein GlcG
MKTLVQSTVTVIGLMLLAAIADADHLDTKRALTLSVTKKIAAAAEAFAKQNQWNVVIAIVDEGGHLLYLQRMDGVQTGSVRVAMQKAETAAAFKRPTKAFQDAVVGGRIALIALPGGMPFDGGVPIKLDGEVLGAIGVSGVTGEQDGMIAGAGAAALSKILAD